MENQEAQARARFVLSDTYAREMYRSMRPRVLIILGIVLFVPVLVYCITKIAWRAIFSYVTGTAFLEGVSMWLAVALLLLYLVGFVWLLFAPRRRGKRLVRRMQELYGAPIEMRVNVLPDALEVRMTSEDSGVRLAYPLIRKCLETPNLFLFVTKEHQVFPIAKQGLLDVDEQTFKHMVELKCPDAKRNWRSAV